MKLFPHNQIAYNKLADFLKTNNKACIVQPTGTGKSYIIAKFIKEHPKSNFLCFTSSNYIIDQFSNSFKDEFENYDFKTYSSLLSTNQEYSNQYDYIILDEFHRAGAQEWGVELEKIIKRYSCAKLIGLSATPIRNDKNDGEKRDMSSELFDNNLVHNLTLREAFDTGILTPPKYIKTLISLDEEYENIINQIQKSNSKNKLELEKTALTKKLEWENSNGVKQILKKHISIERNFIVFCKSKEHLNEMIPLVKDWFKSSFDFKINISKIYSDYVNSNNELLVFIENTKINNQDFNLLFVIDKLNEGIHIKNIHGLIFLRPTDSHIIYYQQLGRCLETNAKQSLLFDMVNNFNVTTKIDTLFNSNESYKRTFSENELQKNYENFKVQFKVYDEVEDYRNIFLEISQSVTSWKLLYNKILKSYNGTQTQKQWLNYQRTIQEKLTEEQVLLMDKLNPIIGYKWNEYRIKTWEERYNEILTAYNGKKTQKDWIKWQRTNYNKNTLTNEQITLMDKLNPIIGWDWQEYRKKTWEESYNEILTAYNGSKTQKNWIKIQKTIYDKNKLTEEQIQLMDKLNSIIGYEWNLNKNKKWIETYNEILTSYNGDVYHKNWIKAQKTYKEKLTEEQIQLMDKLNSIIGYEWYEYRKKTWEESYNEILTAYNDSETQKQWLNGQKTIYTKNKFNKDRIQLMDKLNPIIGYEWNKIIFATKSWEERYNEILTSYNGNKTQKNWIKAQKTFKEKLTEERIQLMDKLNPIIGYEWNLIKTKTWEQQYNEILTSYNGSETQIIWLKIQRAYSKKNKLTNEKIQLMDKLNLIIGYKWNEKNLKYWNDSYDEILTSYNGSEAQKDWIKHQRTNYNKNTLTDKQIQLMDKLNPIIGYEWNVNKTKTWKERYNEILTSYNGSETQIIWLKKQKARKNKLTNEQIQLMDKLNPIIGFNMNKKNNW